MTVRELIALLKHMPQDATILLKTRDIPSLVDLRLARLICAEDGEERRFTATAGSERAVLMEG